MNHHGTTATTTTARSTTTSLHMIPPVVFDAAPWISANVVVVAANLVGLILSLVTGSHLHLDLLGTGAFSLASLMAFKSSLLRVQVSSGAVFLWSAKLASFLFYRALQIKTDARLDDLLSTPSGTGKFTHTCCMH
jgi:steroid 5-alpha reductase family enzyme